MKQWKVIYMDGGILLEKTISCSTLYNLGSALSNNGISEWGVVSISQVPQQR